MKTESLGEDTWDLRRGDQVVAVQLLDPEGAGVPAGAVGVVFEEWNPSRADGMPMVRWDNGGVCGVLPGDVGKVPAFDGLRPSASEVLKAVFDDDPTIAAGTCGCCEEKRKVLARLKPWQLP